MGSEQDPASPPWGHQIDVGGLLRDVVRLASFIHAGPGISIILRGPDRAPDRQLARFREIVGAHLRTDIPHLMISMQQLCGGGLTVAGSWRSQRATSAGLCQGEKVDSERGEGLSREACNKITHAKKVIPEPTSVENGIKTIGSLVSIYGDRNGKA